MKQRYMLLGVLCIVGGISAFQLGKNPTKKAEKTGSELSKKNEILAQESLGRDTIQQHINPQGQKQAPLKPDVIAKVVSESGSPELIKKFESFQAQEKAYDKTFQKYDAAQMKYRQALQDESDVNGPEVQAALAEADSLMQMLQEETETLNKVTAEFLEDYRVYSFQKFDIAQD